VTTVNMLDAKTRLSQLVQAVENGDETEVIIARNGKPAARLVPVETQRRPVRLGLAANDPAMLALVDLLDDPEVEREMELAWAEFWNEDIMTGQDIVPVEELHARIKATWKS